MATVHRVQIPAGHPVYNGTGKTLDDAIKDAHNKIPRHRQGHGFNKETNELTAPKGEHADVAIRCKVLDIQYESGGIGGVAAFQVRVVED